MAPITFEPQDLATALFLAKQGIPPEVFARGEVDRADVEGNQVNFEVFSAVASMMPRAPHDDDHYLSPDEAEFALYLLDGYGEHFTDLFDATRCPGKSANAVSVFNNIIGRADDRKLADRVNPETACPYTSFAQYTPHELLGLHFSTAEDQILQGGLAVIEVHRNGEPAGAAVVLEKGSILTSGHVLYDKDYQLRKGLTIELPGRSQPIRKEHIRRSDYNSILFKRPSLMQLKGDSKAVGELQAFGRRAARDMVELQFPELDQASLGVKGLQMAQRPPLHGEEVWAIGFPATTDGTVLRSYTIGEAFSVDWLSMGRGKFYTTAHIVPGYSGGALLNSAGELLGINRLFVPIPIPGGEVLRLAEAHIYRDYYDAAEMEILQQISVELTNEGIPHQRWAKMYQLCRTAFLEQSPTFVKDWNEGRGTRAVSNAIAKTCLKVISKNR